MTGSASSQGKPKTGDNSLLALIRLLGRLVPKQFNDEVSLAKGELKTKGIKVGVAVAFFVVAIVFLCFCVVALIGAAILGLGTVMADWLAALIIAAFFLLILIIAALIGLRRLKKAMPLVPEAALYGIKYDIGVLREGRNFDPATLEKTPEQKAAEKAEKEAKAAEAQKAKAAAGPPPSMDQLKTRSSRRRGHVAALRDELGIKLNIPLQRKKCADRTRASIAEFRTGLSYRMSGSAAGDQPDGGASARWKPWTVVAVSAGAVAVFMRRLVRS